MLPFRVTFARPLFMPISEPVNVLIPFGASSTCRELLVNLHITLVLTNQNQPREPMTESALEYKCLCHHER